jgi:hypothetical protein
MLLSSPATVLGLCHHGPLSPVISSVISHVRDLHWNECLSVYDTYVKSACVRKSGRWSQRKLKNAAFPQSRTIHRTVNKLRQTGSLLNKNKTETPTAHWEGLIKSMLGLNIHLKIPTHDTGVTSCKKICEWKFVTCVFSCTRPNKCTYRILVHSSIDFYHCNVFRHYCATFGEFLHPL